MTGATKPRRERVPTLKELKTMARSLGVGGSISFVKAKNWNMGTDGVSLVVSRIGHGPQARIALAAALKALAPDGPPGRRKR